MAMCFGIILWEDLSNCRLQARKGKGKEGGGRVNVYKQVDSFTYLGITLDPSLRWAGHVHRITKKLLSGLGAMGRARAFVTKEVLRTMYQTLLLSHLEYCATAWLPSLVQSNKTLMSQLDRLVNRAARLITGHKLQDHVSAVNLRAEAGIDSVRKRTEITTLVNVFKAIRGGAPVYMSSLFKWETAPTLSVRTTRSELKRLRDYDPHLLFCPPARVTAYRSSLQYYGPYLWNTLPIQQRQLLIESPGHTVTLDKVRILDTEQDYFVRGVKEAVYIRAHQPSLNRDGGRYRLPATFDALLTSSRFRLPESQRLHHKSDEG
ncbi:hypothetical protein Bbelb_223100 [Branchiostoma belcheri]|nr:hypothetical protein Bbelb_223100 [Branchiostoma belcheri]